MDNTKIDWCDSTWNPITGCLHGCEYCYARQMANRFKGYDKITLPDVSIDKGRNVLLVPAEKNGKIAPYPFNFKPTFHKYLLDKPQHWKKPRTIFVGSMTDLFGDWVPKEWIEEVFTACEKAPQHRYLFLTKNPKRYTGLISKGKLPIKNNMWYGSTVAEPNTSFIRSAIYNVFLSIEPILKPLNADIKDFSGIDWVIIGAETGNRKNKVIPQKEWITDIIEKCDRTRNGIPVFMKNSLIPIVGEENMRREFP